MSRTKSPSTGTPYGLARVLGAWGMPRSTYYWQRTRRHNPLEARKRGPKTAFSDRELTERLRQEIAASPFTGEGHRKFWARLRLAGVRTSKARVLRLMRDAQLLAVRSKYSCGFPFEADISVGSMPSRHGPANQTPVRDRRFSSGRTSMWEFRVSARCFCH